MRRRLRDTAVLLLAVLLVASTRAPYNSGTERGELLPSGGHGALRASWTLLPMVAAAAAAADTAEADYAHVGGEEEGEEAREEEASEYQGDSGSDGSNNVNARDNAKGKKAQFVTEVFTTTAEVTHTITTIVTAAQGGETVDPSSQRTEAADGINKENGNGNGNTKERREPVLHFIRADSDEEALTTDERILSFLNGDHSRLSKVASAKKPAPKAPETKNYRKVSIPGEASRIGDIRKVFKASLDPVSRGVGHDRTLLEVLSQRIAPHLRLVLLYCRHILEINTLEVDTKSSVDIFRRKRSGSGPTATEGYFPGARTKYGDEDTENGILAEEANDYDETSETMEHDFSKLPELHKVSKHIREAQGDGNEPFLMPAEHGQSDLFHEESVVDTIVDIFNYNLSLLKYGIDFVMNFLVNSTSGSDEENDDAFADILVLNSSYYRLQARGSNYETQVKKAEAYYKAIKSRDNRVRPTAVPTHVEYYGAPSFNLTTNDPDFVNNPESVFPDFESIDDEFVLKTKALRVIRLLAVKYKDEEAIELLGDIFLFGMYYQKRNFRKAFTYYTQLSNLGSSVGHRKLGILHATGLGTKRNYDKAMAYFTFAASSFEPDTTALHILGNYHLHGLGTKRTCTDAAYYFARAAEATVEESKRGPPLGKALPAYKERVYDSLGGLYGPGSSGVGDPSITDGDAMGFASKSKEETEAILIYYKNQADSGDPVAQVLLGQLFYQGSIFFEQDFTLARKYFSRVVRDLDLAQLAVDGKVELDDASMGTRQALSAAAQSYGTLGLMYLRGEGVPQNNETARGYFEHGVLLENVVSFLGLGVMYNDGSGGLKKDPTKAITYIQFASERGNADAQYMVGKHFLDQDADLIAMRFMRAAASKLHLEAMFTVAMDMILSGKPGSCRKGVQVLQDIVEKADWHDNNMSQGQKYYDRGDYSRAFIHYMIASELGYQSAQANAAYLIDSGVLDQSWDIQQEVKWHRSKRDMKNIPNEVRDHTPQEVPSKDIQDLDLWEYALALWHRSWMQGNVDAGNKIGDYYFYGLGNHASSPVNSSSNDSDSNSNSESQDVIINSEEVNGTTIYHSITYKDIHVDYDRAAMFYLLTRNENSALGMWNLGYMYEYGLGVERDLVMAEALYSESMKINPQAYLPAILSLLYVKVKRFLDIIYLATMTILGRSHTSAGISGKNYPLTSQRLTPGGLFRAIISFAFGSLGTFVTELDWHLKLVLVLVGLIAGLLVLAYLKYSQIADLRTLLDHELRVAEIQLRTPHLIPSEETTQDTT